MRFFGPLYDRVLMWSRHPHAERYLAVLSFAESSFFPIPPDVMLAPMTLANPRRAWWLALLTTVASVIGGLVGYLIGWAALVAGFSPVPYKIFTIAAGALSMFLPGFVLASMIGRGGRFFLVAGIIAIGGPPMERRLRQHIDLLGWITVAAIVAAVVVWRLH